MPRNAKTPLPAALGCAIGVLVLGLVAQRYGPVERLDRRILLAVDHERVYRESGSLAMIVSHYGQFSWLLIWLALAITLGLVWGRRREVIVGVAVVIGANLTTQVLKVAFEHGPARSFQEGYGLPWSNSYPSGHVTTVASVAVAFLLIAPARHRRTAAIAGGLLTAAVGLATLIRSWHYPSDVIGAMLVACAWGLAGLALLRLLAARDGGVEAQERPRAARPAVPIE